MQEDVQADIVQRNTVVVDTVQKNILNFVRAIEAILFFIFKNRY